MEIDLIGISQNISKIRKLTDQVADTDLNIVVCGETGVGKEVVVRSLYEKSKRCGKPFVKVNCAALPDTLLESEMFGYERGAFTGAQKKMRGKFEQADSGVLFLDEIGDMPLALQSKLLHALQDGDFTPLGSEKLISTDVWVIAATNHNLKDDIENGKFRADLYHRLNEIQIYIEPLRSRPEDIPYLIDYFTKKYQVQLNKKPLRALSKSTAEKMINYHWPGNVRELENCIERAVLLCEDQVLHSYHLPPTLQTGTESDTLPAVSLEDAVANLEKEMIIDALKNTRGNISVAADILQTTVRKFAYKAQKYGVDYKLYR